MAGRTGATPQDDGKEPSQHQETGDQLRDPAPLVIDAPRPAWGGQRGP